MADVIDTSTGTSTSSINGSSKTNRGTAIVKKSGELDQNSFLRILVAQMSNQDPTKPKDPSETISQLAQFTSLEQLTNLNTNLSFSGATGLIGKTVLLNGTDEKGNANMGNVVGITKNGNNLNVTIQMYSEGKPKVDANGKAVLKDFDYKDVVEVAGSLIPTTTT